MTVKLTEIARAELVCVKCERSDELSKDALCVWCQRCGPSYPVRARRPGGSFLHLSPVAPASRKEEGE